MKKNILLICILMLSACSNDNNTVVENTTLLKSDFPVINQTTDYTCGGASALMILKYFGCDNGITEIELSKKLDTHVGTEELGVTYSSCMSDWGTKINALYQYFSSQPTLKVIETSYKEQYSQNEVSNNDCSYPACDVGNMPPTIKEAEFAKWISKHINNNHPILVEWNLWDGHWSVIIGISDNGTPDDYTDDKIIIAAPYDHADGKCDGRVTYPLLYFFYSWNDRVFAPKPWQLQSDLVIGNAQ